MAGDQSGSRYRIRRWRATQQVVRKAFGIGGRRNRQPVRDSALAGDQVGRPYTAKSIPARGEDFSGQGAHLVEALFPGSYQG